MVASSLSSLQNLKLLAMKISALIGGGLGDMILSTRFIAACRDSHPESEISVFAIDKGITRHSDFVVKNWGYLFNKFTPVSIVNPNYRLVSSCGEETYPEAYLNILESDRQKIENCDKMYNFIPDAMRFSDYFDIPWVKYRSFIPKPSSIAGFVSGEYILLNLFVRQDSPSSITKEHSNAIISELVKSHKVVIVAPSEDAKINFYSDYRELVEVASLDRCLQLVAGSKLGVSVDTGIRCMFHALGKTCFTITQNFSDFFQSPLLLEERWYPWQNCILPRSVSPLVISHIVNNAVSRKLCEVYPRISPENLDKTFLIRRYD